MKNMKKLFALLVAVVMVFAMTAVAFAADQTVDSDDNGTATITIKNAARGETYSVVKIFDAKVTGAEDGSIVYTGTIPSGLEEYFTTNASGNIVVKVAADADAKAVAAAEAAAASAAAAWAENQTPTAEVVSDGTQLVFTNLQYGYYAVLTTQGTAVTVDSTNPNAVVIDKNTSEPTVVKTVDDENVYIGQTVTYTVVAQTTNNLNDAAGESKAVVTYEIVDTLPDFLTNVTITSVDIDADGDVNTTNDRTTIATNATFDDEGEYAIAWVDEDGVSKYNNGVAIIVTYTATVTEKATVDGNGNKNEVTLKPYINGEPGEPDNPENPGDPWKDNITDSAVIKTYAVALKKVDNEYKPLAGAKFAIDGLEVEGSNGNYTVISYDPTSTTPGTSMDTDVDGDLVIKGIASDEKLQLSELVAPDGYNKLAEKKEITVTPIGEEITVTSTITYYDEDGKVANEETETSTTSIEYNSNLEAKAIQIVNNKGAELPSTGGIGTTIFYVVGGLLVVGAAIVLISKKRMSKEA